MEGPGVERKKKWGFSLHLLSYGFPVGASGEELPVSEGDTRDAGLIPMDCSPPGSSVHGIFQAKVLK